MTSKRTTSSGPRRERRKPQRSCVACRRAGDQATFVRIVRRPDGPIEVDEAGRAPGRGAYLCRQDTCWKQGLAGALGGAFKRGLTDTEREALVRHARRYAAGDEREGEAE